MAAPDFIVPPPGLIPNAPEAPAPPSPSPSPDRTVRAPVRSFPAFTPVPSGPPTVPSPPTADEPTPEVPVASTAPPTQPAPAIDVLTAASGAGSLRLTGVDGSVIHLEGRVVLGRAPAADAADPDARPVAVDDPARSVSKTHALVDARSGAVTVTDLHSTNGVRVVSPDGTAVEVDPGVPAPVSEGQSLYLGDLGFRLDRVPRDTV